MIEVISELRRMRLPPFGQDDLDTTNISICVQREGLIIRNMGVYGVRSTYSAGLNHGVCTKRSARTYESVSLVVLLMQSSESLLLQADILPERTASQTDSKDTREGAMTSRLKYARYAACKSGIGRHSVQMRDTWASPVPEIWMNKLLKGSDAGQKA